MSHAWSHVGPGAAARAIGHAASAALRAELMLHPKPGLVTPHDRGSHHDMDAATFRDSIAALDGYFSAIAQAGADGHGFAVLRDLGIAAEQRMLAATGGINTHRGAVFCLGLLAAAAGSGAAPQSDGLGRRVVAFWGGGIAEAGRASTASHGAQAVRRHGARGARDEALAGFPTLFGIALPVLGDSLKRAEGHPDRDSLALTQTLFAVMARLEDTNLLHRGGAEGLALVQAAARDFLARGGVFAPGWRRHAQEVEDLCRARWLSPGGAADVIAAAWFVHLLRRGR